MGKPIGEIIERYVIIEPGGETENEPESFNVVLDIDGEPCVFMRLQEAVQCFTMLENTEDRAIVKESRQVITPVDLWCPFCKSRLVEGEEKKFETLLEHVDSEYVSGARELPVRPTAVCINGDCPMQGQDVFWDEGGEFFAGVGSLRITREHSRNSYDESTWDNQGTYALGSTARQIEDDMIAEEKKKRGLKDGTES